MAGRFSVEAVFKAVDRVTRPVSRMQNRVGKFTRSMNRNFTRLNRTVNKFGRGMKRAGQVAAVGLLIVGAAMNSVIATGAEFEQTLVNAAAKFPGEIRRGTEAFEQLELAARKMGSTTEFTATQSAEALNFLAMAGFNAESAIVALPGVVDLATAAQVDLGTATDIATDSLGAFNLMTKDATQLGINLARVNDVIAKTSTSANTTVEALFEAMKEGGPIAVTAGASLETFAALAGELANAGIKGSRAGTTLKNMFLKLAAPTTKGAKLLRQFGVQTQDASGDMLDIVAILGNLNKSLDGLGTAQKSGVLEGIFGKIPLAGVNILLKVGTERLNEYRQSLIDASGASTTMASVMRDTVQGRINSLKSAIEGVSISIFSMNRGPLAGAIEKMTEWVRANEQVIATNIGEFIASIVNNFEDIVKWTKRIGKGILVFVAFATILKTLIGVLTLVNLVIAANPITLIILGIMAAIAAIAAIIFWWDELKAAFMATPTWVKVVAAAIAILSGPIGLLITAAVLIMENWGVIKQFFSNLWSGIVEVFNSSVDSVSEILNKLANSPAAELFMSIWRPVTQFFVDLWAGVVDVFKGVVSFFANAWDGIVNIFDNAVNLVSGAINRVKEIFGGLPGPVKASIAILAGPIGWLIGAAALIMEHWEPIKEFFAGLWDGIGSTFESGLDFVTGIFNKMFEIFDDIVGFFDDIGSSIADFFGFGDEVAENPAAAKAKVAEAVTPKVKVKQPELFIVPNIIVDQPTEMVIPDITVIQPTALIEPIADVTQPVINIVPQVVTGVTAASNDDEFTPVDITQQGPQIVTPQDRVARSIEESRESSFAEVTIKDETGRAEKTAGEFGPGIKIQNSGGF